MAQGARRRENVAQGFLAFAVCAAVTGAAAFARAYCETDLFRARYAKQRGQARPTPPPPAKSWAEQKAEQKAQFDKSMAEMKANAAKAGPTSARCSKRPSSR